MSLSRVACFRPFSSRSRSPLRRKYHARFHADSGSPDHECAVTLIATGKYEQADAPPVVVVPQLAVVFEDIPSFAPAWVASSFLGARIFEHAPPALS